MKGLENKPAFPGKWRRKKPKLKLLWQVQMKKCPFGDFGGQQPPNVERFNPWIWGARTPHASWPKTQRIKQKKGIVTNSIKTLRILVKKRKIVKKCPLTEKKQKCGVWNLKSHVKVYLNQTLMLSIYI